MRDRGHKSEKVLDELASAHCDHRAFALRSIKLIRDLDELRVNIEPLKPTIFAIVSGLSNRIDLMPAIFKPRVTHGEIP